MVANDLCFYFGHIFCIDARKRKDCDFRHSVRKYFVLKRYHCCIKNRNEKENINDGVSPPKLSHESRRSIVKFENQSQSSIRPSTIIIPGEFWTLQQNKNMVDQTSWYRFVSRIIIILYTNYENMLK